MSTFTISSLPNMHGTPEDRIKPIREKIVQGEIFLKDLLVKLIAPILEEISQEAGDLNKKESIKSDILSWI
jgi:hypothetical protein